MTTDRVYNVLFLCTGNSARSILAESILNMEGKGRFKAYSAGSRPKGEINPFALRELEALGYPTVGFRSKNWDEFAEPGAPPMDFIFTVCDSAAVEDSDIGKGRAFAQAARFLKNRIMAFISLPLASIDKLALETHLRQIGTMEGASINQPEARR